MSGSTSYSGKTSFGDLESYCGSSVEDGIGTVDVLDPE